MLKLNTPRGLPVDVPKQVFKDPSPEFDLDDAESIRAHYEANGHVVVRGVIQAKYVRLSAICGTVR